jgi:hypothetical protein
MFLLEQLLEQYRVPTTVDAIDEVDETFNIANGTVSTTGTILDDNNPLLWQRSLLLRLPRI